MVVLVPMCHTFRGLKRIFSKKGSKTKVEIEIFYIFKYNFKKNILVFKLYYLILNAKLLLINVNHEDIFF